MKSDNKKQDQRISSLSRSNSSLKKQVAALEDEVDDLEDDVTSVEKKLANNQANTNSGSSSNSNSSAPPKKHVPTFASLKAKYFEDGDKKIYYPKTCTSIPCRQKYQKDYFEQK